MSGRWSRRRKLILIFEGAGEIGRWGGEVVLGLQSVRMSFGIWSSLLGVLGLGLPVWQDSQEVTRYARM